jgi:hypothetical protein
MRNNDLYTTQSLHASANLALEILSLDTGLPMRAVLGALVLAASDEAPHALRDRLLPYLDRLGPTITRPTAADHRAKSPALPVPAQLMYPLWRDFCRIKDQGMMTAFVRKLTERHAASPLQGDELADATKVWKASPPSLRPPEFQ